MYILFVHLVTQPSGPRYVDSLVVAHTTPKRYPNATQHTTCAHEAEEDLSTY